MVTELTGAPTTITSPRRAVTVLFLVMFGFFYLAMQFMQLVMGYSPIGTAVALSPLAVPMLVLSPMSLWYLPGLGLRLVVFTGLLLLAAGRTCLRLVHLDSPYWDLAWPLPPAAPASESSPPQRHRRS
ncbi:hypothetical protein [Mycobacterium sp. OTB74]|jgi:hypothetical protein|uniref:hypothetical protein n=1 Tax=Mycobacterium sp. OTB74 TaxID=1853452 RepID=UPI0024764242|nr:hypothetical protein [Mycobacterium sp. OTB74]MDH6244811.1 hypothetical protein [Mycobacterium sp. OTB74]